MYSVSEFRKEQKPLNSNKPQGKKFLISIIVPAYNEAESLPELFSQIASVCDRERLVFEVIFIDDGSTDGTFDALRELFHKDPRVKIIQFRKNFGKSAALSAGFDAASGEYVITMDADLQDDPEEIPALVREIEKGYDLVSGWKETRHDPVSKRFPSWVWNIGTSIFTGLKLHDFNCGLKIYRYELIKELQVYGELHRYIPALAHWQGFSVGEIPVHHRPRLYGKTKFGASRFIKGFLDLITVMFLGKYTKRPLHLFGSVGFVFTLAGGGITLYLIVLRILKQSYLSNRPLLYLGILFLIIGVQFISIGLLGEMITRSQPDEASYSVKKTLGV